MRKSISLTLLLTALTLSSCSKESPELIPCMCDGSKAESTMGLFDCMCEPMKKKPVKRISYIQDQKPQQQTLLVDDNQRNGYLYLHQRREDYAPVQLQYVDFRIKKGRRYDNYDTKLGNYRFRIFGCRRESKNVFLNQGRAMQKDMRFFDIFYENMDEYYPVVVDKSNRYYLESERIKYPEYILTAEINDYFMNICDEFDWENVKQRNIRSGTSEATITWRLMDLSRSHVYCKGTTTGYGQISEGEANGETLLVERAFEDALNKLPEVDCFDRTLSQRVPVQELEQQIAELQEIEYANRTFRSQFDKELKGISLLQNCGSGIQENYQIGSNSSNIDMKGGTTATGNTFDASSGQIGDGSRIDSNGNVIELNAGSNATTGSYARNQRNTTGLVMDDNCHAVEINECTTVSNIDNKVKLDDDYWVDVPLTDGNAATVANRIQAEEDFSNANNNFCIRNQTPYASMTPQNLYKVRASVVEVANPIGKKGVGILVSDQLILTSADLMVKEDNNFNIRTINGGQFRANAFRVNPNKNVALLLLNDKVRYTPLPLSLELPEVNKDVFLTLGLLNQDEGEGYLENESRIIGYRWSEERGTEIIVDTYVQTVTLGGTLIDKNGNIVGISHAGKNTQDTPDLFIPIETALKGLGLEICGRQFSGQRPPVTKTIKFEEKVIYKTVNEKAGYNTSSSEISSAGGSKSSVSRSIDSSDTYKEPERMKGLERK